MPIMFVFFSFESIEIWNKIYTVFFFFYCRHRQQYLNMYLPWALKTGYNAKFLMAVYYENHWEQNLEEFQRELNIEPAPRPIKKTGKRTLS